MHAAATPMSTRTRVGGAGRVRRLACAPTVYFLDLADDGARWAKALDEVEGCCKVVITTRDWKGLPAAGAA